MGEFVNKLFSVKDKKIFFEEEYLRVFKEES